MKGYMKAYEAPATWTGITKARKFVTNPRAGPHSKQISMPLNEWLKQLGVASTVRESKKLLNTTEVKVDERRIKDPKLPVGFMDTISFEDGKSYRVAFDKKGRLTLEEEKDPKTKACKIIGKQVLKGGKLQLNLIDGRNIRTEGEYKIGDTVVIELPSQKVIKHIKLEKGTPIAIIAGKYCGSKGKLESIEGDKITYKENKETVETLKEYAFATQ